jgi:hypothetical protein
MRTPKGLGPGGGQLWRSVTADYELERHEVVLLLELCRAVDTCAALQARVDAEGLTQENRLGEVKMHPALVELRQQRLMVGKLIALMRIPLGEAVDDAEGRGQLRAIRGVYVPGMGS